MKTSKVFLLIILTLSSSYLVYIRPVNATEDSWVTLAPIPTKRYFFGVAVVNDILYAIGGVTGWIAPTTTANEQYTPAGYIPEFPSWIILPLLIVATLGVIIARNKLSKKGLE